MNSEQQAFINWLLTLVCVFFLGYNMAAGEWWFAAAAGTGFVVSLCLPEDE
jgi:hypothetical protein